MVESSYFFGDGHNCSLETGMRPTHFIQGTEHLSDDNDVWSLAVLARCELADLDYPPESLLKNPLFAPNLGLPNSWFLYVQPRAFSMI